MKSPPTHFVRLCAAGAVAACGLLQAQTVPTPPQAKAPPDAIQEAQTPRAAKGERPEQKKGDADEAGRMEAKNAKASSEVLKTQPDKGMVTGFDFARDPLNAKEPMQKPEDIVEADKAAKDGIMEKQRELLNARYNLEPKFHPEVTMTRGKPVPMGPTARLAEGVTWESLMEKTPEEMKKAGSFPYPSLPHPKHATGGQVFPQMQIDMFPRLQRFDVDFDLPDAFIPEFPPAMFLQHRPDLGDVSRGEVISINNFYSLFKDMLTPVQLDGLRLLLTPMPQEEFNATDDRKTEHASLGVTCFDCHVNGHTTAQFHLNPDTRPQHARFRLDTTSLRGMFNQQVHGSKRSLRSVEDFTEFEQRTAYFNGDQIHAFKKGAVILDRVQVSHMAQLQNMLDFPPAPKLDPSTNRLNSALATEQELRGEQLFHGKAKCATCHTGPAFMDQQYHDLRVERFVDEPARGPIKTFTLRGIKDSPPYLHDGRCLTLEDTVEFFNLVLQLQLTAEEKADLTAFMLTL